MKCRWSASALPPSRFIFVKPATHHVFGVFGQPCMVQYPNISGNMKLPQASQERTDSSQRSLVKLVNLAMPFVLSSLISSTGCSCDEIPYEANPSDLVLLRKITVDASAPEPPPSSTRNSYKHAPPTSLLRTETSTSMSLAIMSIALVEE